jgi:hypothetical protein
MSDFRLPIADSQLVLHLRAYEYSGQKVIVPTKTLPQIGIWQLAIENS